MTHRDFSRNAASSRAIPVAKMVTDVQTNPFIPFVWTKNQPGMQGYEVLGQDDELKARLYWRQAVDNACVSALALASVSVHKQIANRVLMPYMYITVLISSTRWENFLGLRLHKTAEPHMRVLADQIDYELRRSVPRYLTIDGMHLPFVSREEQLDLTRIDQIRLSVARCASTSYKTVEGFNMDLGRAKVIHDSLVSATPMHASPAEHVAFVGETEESGNFDRGWVQYRKTLRGERITPDDWLSMRTDEDYRFVNSAPV